MIIGEIRRYLRDNSALRVSRSLRDTAYRALQVKEAFVREHQREPDIVELARAMNVPKEEVVFALDAILDPVSLFEPVFHDGTDTVCVMDQVGDTRNTDDHWLAAIALREAIDGLGEREKRIIRLRFFEGRTQMEVAREIHLSPNKRKQETGQKQGKLPWARLEPSGFPWYIISKDVTLCPTSISTASMQRICSVCAVFVCWTMTL